MTSGPQPAAAVAVAPTRAMARSRVAAAIPERSAS